jgi:hypothetical protein
MTTFKAEGVFWKHLLAPNMFSSSLVIKSLILVEQMNGSNAQGTLGNCGVWRQRCYMSHNVGDGHIGPACVREGTLRDQAAWGEGSWQLR